VSPPLATLSEAESKALLVRHGVPVPAETVAATAAEAAEAAAAVGFPVAVKLCGGAITHKTERGLVKLGLRDAAAVEAAGAELLAAARPEDGDVALLVSAMVPGARELIAGFVRDGDFGPCVMLGVGGILAEAVGDVAFRLAPLDAVDADDLIDDLANQALLGPVRGEPPVDRSALAAILLGLSAVGVDDDRIRSIDLNPLIVSGGVPVAVDALIELDR
jgi:acetate---CoA ligase (ADP-forming) subunit beta